MFSLSSAIRSAALASTASAIRYSARLRSLGVESFHSSKAAAAAPMAASMSAAADSGAVA